MSDGKITNIFKKGLDVASILSGGKVKDIINIVNSGIADKNDPNNNQALCDLAEVNEAQTKVLINQEARIRALEAKLGIK